MAKVNTKATDKRFSDERLAGGYGARGANQDAEALLRRVVMANLLWEDLAYIDGKSIAEYIKELVPQVDAKAVYDIAVEARKEQKLRHVPLLLAREMARHASHKKLVGFLLQEIIQRADEITEFVALYWQDGKQPLSKQVKIGLAHCFNKFDAYQFAKYNRGTEVKLRDVMFLVHPRPRSQEQAILFKQIAEDTLPTPDTWEVALSKGEESKTQSWERLISERKLGALAFLRNLRNMEEAKVDHAIIQKGFDTINPRWLLPLNYLSAVKYAPRWISQIEELMLRGLETAPKLPGYTVFVVDVSGSMRQRISGKSEFDRLDVASAMAILAKEVCEDVAIYATAGDDWKRVHKTTLVPNYRGFGLMEKIKSYLGETRSDSSLGGGGIFTRQCLEYIRDKEQRKVDRIIVFSDSQDCDLPNKRTPAPFGDNNYIIDVSAHKRGINYKGVWTAEISGWSEHFIKFIMASEGLDISN